MFYIDERDLTSYLRDPAADVSVYVNLANGVVEDIVGEVDPVPARVIAITLEVAARAFRNPSGFASESIDDYTYRLPTETRQAGVYLTDAERAELLSMTAGPSFGFYSVPLYGSDCV